MKILESYKDMMAEFINEVDDDKMIKYKKKDGEQGEMKAGSAKKMEKDHPAKIAWDKMQDDGDGEEKPKGQAMGGGDFDRDGGDDRGGSDKVDRVFSNEKDKEEEARKQAADSAEKISDKYGIESDIAGNDQGMSYINIGKGGDYEGDNQITVAANDFGDGSSTGGANKGIQYSIAANGPDAMGGPIVGKMFDTKEEMESVLDKLLGNEKIKNALNNGESFEGMKDEIEAIMNGGSDDGDEEKSAESENEKIIGSLEDMDLDGLNVDSLDSAIDSGQYASITGKDDDPDNEMSVNAFTGEDGKVEYGINVGVGHKMIYFDSKEEALEAAQKLFKDDKIRKAMDGEGDETLADLGDHANSIVKGKDETVTINGKKYKPIKESKQHILKENYDRFFGER